MREILFRGKRVDNDEWVCGFYFERVRNYAGYKTVEHCYIKYETWDEGFITYEVKPETVGQYTGLTDKNGKKIFEGDIVKFVYNGNTGIYQVVYDISELDFKATNGKEKYENNFQYLTCCEEIEAIGNIYDNKELLND